MDKRKVIVPKGFFSNVRDVITTKEALKDVTRINWKECLKDRKDNKNQIVKLVKSKID